MLIDGIALGFHIVVSLQEILIVESEVLLLFSGHHQLVFCVPEFGLSFEDLCIQLPISTIFLFRLSLQVRLVRKLAV